MTPSEHVNVHGSIERRNVQLEGRSMANRMFARSELVHSPPRFWA